MFKSDILDINSIHIKKRSEICIVQSFRRLDHFIPDCVYLAMDDRTTDFHVPIIVLKY